MKKLFAVCVVVFLCSCYAKAGTWTTLDAPQATTTYAKGIDGGNIVGSYYDDSGYHHFLYNGSTWATLDLPDEFIWTEISCISGDNIAGTYTDASGGHGFVYNRSTFTTINAPEAIDTIIHGISGNKIVGEYKKTSVFESFLYDGTTWTTLSASGAIDTYAYGIDSDNIVGGYTTMFATHGFLYDGSTWTTLDTPWAVKDISGSYVVGSYYDVSIGDDHGFLYDGTNLTILDAPGASGTRAYSISGNNIVGDYTDGSGTHGFIYTIPEPAAICLFAFAGLFLHRRK